MTHQESVVRRIVKYANTGMKNSRKIRRRAGRRLIRKQRVSIGWGVEKRQVRSLKSERQVSINDNADNALPGTNNTNPSSGSG
jgi:hypothetical protein